MLMKSLRSSDNIATMYLLGRQRKYYFVNPRKVMTSAMHDLVRSSQIPVNIHTDRQSDYNDSLSQCDADRKMMFC